LWAFFQTKLGDMILNQCSHGAAGRNRPLNYNELLNETIPVPAIEKQDRIADLVLLLQRHRILATNNAILLNEYSIRLISDAVTGKIDVRSFEVPEYETAEDNVINTEENENDFAENNE
jgi:type I restriction enzyme S subunit